jgi:hypothetical protein
LSQPQRPSAAGRIKSIEKFSGLIGNQKRDSADCSIVPEASKRQETCRKLIYPEDGSDTILRNVNFTGLHGITFYKAILFFFAAVRSLIPADCVQVPWFETL